MRHLREFFYSLFLPVFFALASSALFLLLVGESPGLLGEALKSTLFTQFGLGYSLFYATPLIFTGLSVALSFHCGLFNIGAEGQLYVGALFIIMFASLFPHLPQGFAIPLAMMSSMLGGGILGFIAGFLKAKRGSHEVIVTILLNFIGILICDYAILYRFKDPSVQTPETLEIAPAYHLSTLADKAGRMGFDLFASTPVNLALLVAIIFAFGAYFLLFFTVRGFELRAVGQNPSACRFTGISVSKNQIMAFVLSGALSGLVGVNEVMGYQHDLSSGFSPQYGFTGIAVALLARNHPLLVIVSALLFGALHNMAREIEFLSNTITKELSTVLQATIIAFVAARSPIERLFAKWLKAFRVKEPNVR